MNFCLFYLAQNDNNNSFISYHNSNRIIISIVKYYGKTLQSYYCKSITLYGSKLNT